MEAPPSLLGSWTLEPLQIVPTALVALLYARRVRTLRRRGTPVERWRVWVFGLGLALVLVALVSPIDAFGERQFFSFHMLQHVLLGDLAPLLFVLGVTGPILRPVLAFPLVQRLQVLAHPLVALPLWAADLYLWHVPYLYDAALGHDSLHALEHLCFFTFGAFMWAPVIEVLPAPAWFGTGAKLAYVAGVRLAGTVLANVFLWASAPIYATYEHLPSRWGLSPRGDQGLAGGVMMIEGSFVTLAILVWLFLRLASESELRQQLLERGLDPRAVTRAVRYGRGRELSDTG